MSIILNDKQIEIPNLKTISFKDKPKDVPFPQSHLNRRTTWLRGIIVHTIEGIKGNVLSGLGEPSDKPLKLAKYQATTNRPVSWDYTIDFDGTIYCHSDPFKWFSWQATQVNPFTLGIELVQHSNGDLYDEQLNIAVTFIDFLTNKLGIQRQIHIGNKIINRTLSQNNSGKDTVGIFGHCNITNNRGIGDPGSYIFDKLKEAGYEQFDFNKNEDINTWKPRQTNLGLPTIDGVAGPQTVIAIKRNFNDKKFGLWIARPIDTSLIT